MNSLCRWCLPVTMLLVVALARGETPGKFTTLPRPRDIAPKAQLPQEPAPPPTGESAPLLTPIGEPAYDSPAVILDPDAPFYRRVRAELLEVAIMFPSIKQNLAADVDVGGLYTASAALPTATLGFTAPVLLNVQLKAWRYGQINVGYRMLVAEGSAVLGGLDPNGPANLRSRLDMNTVDVTFASSGYGPLWNLLWFVNEDPMRPEWGLRWDVGGRFTTFFFDSTASGPTVDRHISNYFIGGGPHVALKLHRTLGNSGISLFGRADFGINMGSVRQQFSELSSDLGGNPLGFGYTARTSTRTVPTLTANVGIGGDPPLMRRSRWEIAYQFEQWWGIGDAGPSRLDLLNHGLVMRWYYSY